MADKSGASSESFNLDKLKELIELMEKHGLSQEFTFVMARNSGGCDAVDRTRSSSSRLEPRRSFSGSCCCGTGLRRCRRTGSRSGSSGQQPAGNQEPDCWHLLFVAESG